MKVARLLHMGTLTSLDLSENLLQGKLLRTAVEVVTKLGRYATYRYRYRYRYGHGAVLLRCRWCAI